jgi:hypothetical protein
VCGEKVGNSGGKNVFNEGRESGQRGGGSVDDVLMALTACSHLLNTVSLSGQLRA